MISDVARAWASAGFHVVRLWPGTKHPTKKQFQLPENRYDPMDAEQAWYQNPEYNLAVIPASAGYVVVDCDGDEALAFMAREHPEALDTLTAVTPRGNGRHYWFRAPDGAAFRGKLRGREDIDVKWRGFVLLPPSEVLFKGRYRWVRRQEPAALPDRLMEAIAQPSGWEPQPDMEYEGWALEAITEAWVAQVLATRPGNRNNVLFQAWADGADPERVYRAVEAAGWPDLDKCAATLRLTVR